MIWKPRVTVAVVAERHNKFLMVEEDIRGTVRFNQPAGHLEDNESLIDAAVRECLEETAWQFQGAGRHLSLAQRSKERHLPARNLLRHLH